MHYVYRQIELERWIGRGKRMKLKYLINVNKHQGLLGGKERRRENGKEKEREGG